VPALANIATADKPRVPAEYRGLTRLFREEVRAVDEAFDRALATIAAPLIARLRRHHRLRHELVAAAVHRYRRTAPAAFRLGEVSVMPDRDAFEIAEVRLTATWINSTTWDSDAHEPGVAVARASLAMRPGRGMVQEWMPIAICSAHGIGRWFERTGLRDHGMLVRDLAVLAAAGDDGDHVATPDGGYWLGSVIIMGGTDKVTARARHIRTWVDE
jgi:hypothetical protein